MNPRLILWLVAVACAFGLAMASARPPAVAPADAPANRFSAERAFADIRIIAAQPHPTGSIADAAVRSYLADRLRKLGLEVSIQPVPLSPRAHRVLKAWKQPGAAEAQAFNVIGVLPGHDRAAPAIVLMAHHDTVPGSPGAADDSAGVAAILETVRALKSSGARRRDLVVAFTDAEEESSDGAAAFFETRPQRPIGAVINLETRGGGGRALMFETGARNDGLMALYARRVEHPSALSAAVMAYRLMSNSTDFTLAVKRGLSGVNLAYLGDPELYHAPQATPERIDRRSVQHLGGQALDLTRALVEAPELPPRTSDAVFADLLGQTLIVYPAWAGWAVLAAAAALLAFAAARAARSGGLTVGGVAAGAGGALLATVSAGVLLFAFNLVSGAGPEAGYYDRLAALPWLELQAMLIGLAVLVGFATRPSGQPWSRWLGAALVVGAAAVAVQVVAPLAGPLFAWPLLALALAAALGAALDPRLASAPALAAMAVIGVVAGAQTLGLAHFIFLALGAELPMAAALFGFLAAAPLLPLLAEGLGSKSRRIATALLLLAALACALWVRFDPPAPTVPAYARATIG